MEKGFTIKLKDEEVDLEVIGTLDLTLAAGLTMTALHTFMYKVFEDLMERKDEDEPDISEEEKSQTIRATIYDKVVYTFSTFMHEFFPEAAELRAKEDGFDEFIKKINDSNKQE